MDGTIAGLAVYFDDPPVDPADDSRGLGPVNARILDMLSPCRIWVNMMRLRAGQSLHRRADTAVSVVYAGLSGLVIRAAGRLGLPGIGWLEAALLRRSRMLLPPRSATMLFAPLGSDIGSLRRAARIARRSGLAFLPYLVDDPIETLRGHGASRTRIARAERIMATSLRDAVGVFAITAQLGERLAQHTSRPVFALPLPYDDPAPPATPGHDPVAVRPRIIYIGSVNEIYETELRYWVDALSRRGFFEWGDLLVTSSVADMPQVTVTAFADRRELYRAIAGSAACLLPVSSRRSNLHRSSFPSKLLDYLAHGRLILCSAPADSVAAGFFADNALPCLFEEQAVDFDLVETMLRECRDASASYRAVIDTQFSSARFVDTIVAALAEGPEAFL